MTDTRSMKDKATELFAKGKFARAAESYAAYCEAEPKDLQARLRMGDAWVKAGQKSQAIEAYQAAAEGFARDGFLPRAIAASKLVLELDPSHKSISRMLADLYARKSGSARAAARSSASRPGIPSPLAPSVVAPAPVAPAVASPVAAHAGVEGSPGSATDATESIAVSGDEGIEIEVDSRLATGEFEIPIGEAFHESAAAAPLADPGVGSASALARVTGTPPLDPVQAPRPEHFELDVEATSVAPPASTGTPPAQPDASGFELEVEPAGPGPESGATPAADDASGFGLEVEPVPSPAEADVSTGARPAAADAERLELEVGPAPSLAQGDASSGARPAAGDASGFELEVGPAPSLAQGDASSGAQSAAGDASGFELEVEVEPASSRNGSDASRSPRPVPAAVEAGELGGARSSLPRDPLVSARAAGTASAAEQAPGLAVAAGAGGLAPPPVRASAAWSPRPWLAPPGEGLGDSPAPGGAAASGAGTDEPASEVRTELERSLDALVGAPAAPVTPSVASFTELELDGDSLLQAVEVAAGRAMPPAGSSDSFDLIIEEAIEDPDDGRLVPGALPRIPLFSDLPEDAFIALFEGCPLRRVEVGERIIDQGSVGTSFFVICAGRVRVVRTDGATTRDLATLDEGAFFGEMALLSDAPRSASVEAIAEDTQLLEIPASVLTGLSARFPSVAAALKKFCRQRLLTNLMNGAALFKPFTPRERRELIERFRAREARTGETLIREGQPSDGLFVILTGEVVVEAQGRHLARLHEGQIFGEMSLLTRAPATATVRTARRTSLLRLPQADFRQLIMSHPQILELIATLTDDRRRQNDALEPRPDAMV